jgi:cytosine/adenosine deaminase-related metal-dependent hydrolase/ubiquinone/menaquinone biosynthesis C-methylase UbiE
VRQKLVSPVTLFDAWAAVYDTQPNPLLSLEQSVLPALLPDIQGLDVLDAGCGTGRWLSLFEPLRPRTLTGVDVSSEMLAVARSKLSRTCDLKTGACEALPVEDESADVLLVSFVLSYVGDLEAFAAEADRVLRPGGTLLVSDMHPQTEAALGWKRTFPTAHEKILLPSHGWPLPRIIRAFEERGCRLAERSEPPFGEAERAVFAKQGKTAEWAASEGRPAIYALKWRKPAIAPRRRRAWSDNGPLMLHGGRCARAAGRAESSSLCIESGRIHAIGNSQWNTPGEVEVDLSGCLLLPGLMNAHDHLEFGLFPRLGGGPYQNASDWARDIHVTHAETIARWRRVPRHVAVWWGAIRNLLAGVTTVCHHNPILPEMTQAGFPVRVVTDFAWGHSPAFEPKLAEQFSASDPSLPFIVHAAEGIDEQSAEEIFALDDMGLLSDRTLLVHALACSPAAIALINRAKTTVVVCPTSNCFLFARHHSFEMIQALHSVVLGSDSPLTAAGDLLNELRFAHQQIGLDAATIYDMVTRHAARALRLKQGQGRLAPGAVADLLIVRDSGLTPAQTLLNLHADDIELVILQGRVQLSSEAALRRLPRRLTRTLEPLEVDGRRHWIRAPISRLLAEAEAAPAHPLMLGKKRVGHATA